MARMPLSVAVSSPVFIERAEAAGFQELVMPVLDFADVYANKAGPEILSQMYTFPDRKGRELCLRPEGTATCQLLANSDWKKKRNVQVWYETRCFRYERPQKGRYREFFQFGIEVLNPTRDWREELITLSQQMVGEWSDYRLARQVKRGLAYYLDDGWEISCPQLGAQQQVLGGGRYAEGIGFAIGLDRLVLASLEH